MSGADTTIIAGAKRLGRYVLLQELGRGSTGIVYEACDTESNAVVALKTLVSMNAESLLRLKHEFRSLANVEHGSFVRLGELACEDGQWFFTMQRVHGSDFLDYVRCGERLPPSPEDRARGVASASHVRAAPATIGDATPLRLEVDEARLRSAVAQLVEGLAALHETGRLHRDVKPSNVMVTDEGRLVLLDFGLTTGFGVDEAIVGTPAYMAPEQIAGEPLSAATDWYAVGVMLFAALTGRLPFEGELTAVLHEKMWNEAPRDWGEGAPEDLRALAAAMLEREPHARPSVEEIRARLGLAPPVRPAIREVFVGRDAELARLKGALARARSGAHVIVRGEPGMGKSALVERFLSELPARTLVLRGRCYETETIPFGAVDALIDEISGYLWTLPSNEVDRLIAGGLSNLARVFPVLCRVPIIAAQTPNRAVDNPAMLREPAFRELRDLLAALSRSRPLVFFLDDVQWADPDSMALIRRALLSSGGLLIATMRSGIPPSMDLAALVADLETVEVRGLSRSESLMLLETLGATADDASNDDAVRQADGHPLLLTELLRSARSDAPASRGSLRLQDVLWQRISRRDDVDRRFLEMVSLAGAPTDYTVIARAAGVDVGECFTRLAALRAGQLVRVSREGAERRVEPYHDRIRETLLEHAEDGRPGRATSLHLQLGRALLDATPEAALAARIFSIVEHLNLARDLVESPQEAARHADLNLLASRQALLATAFESARQYAWAGVQCLRKAYGEDGWPRDPGLHRGLHIARLHGEYRTGRRDEARETFETLERRVRGPLDRAEIFIEWIGLESTGGYAREAVEAGREILRELGASLPSRPTPLHVFFEFALTRRAQKGRTPEELQNLPPLRDPRTESILRILAALAPAAFQATPALLPWMLMRVARTSMDLGLSTTSAYGFASYGMVLAGALDRYAEGAAFGAMAVSLADRDDNPRFLAKTHYVNATFVVPWVGGYAGMRAAVEKAADLSRACGDTEYQAYAQTTHAILDMAAASEVGAMRERVERAREFVLLCNADSCRPLVEGVHRYSLALTGETRSLVDWSLAGSSHDDFLNSQGESSHLGYLGLAELAYLTGAVARAEAYVRKAHRLRHFAFGTPTLIDVWYWSALVAARRIEGASPGDRVTRLAHLAGAARRLDAWSRSFPANAQPRAWTVRAEVDRVVGRSAAATRGYEDAILSARAFGTAKHEAIACGLAARHAQTRRDMAAARRYRHQEIDAYRRWGATAVVHSLEDAPIAPSL